MSTPVSLSAPTIESLRSAGTETPSGRLVIDIERLRQSRAAASRATQPDVVAHAAMPTNGSRPAGVETATRTAVLATDTEAPEAGATNPAPPISRMRIFFGKKPPGAEPSRPGTRWLLIGSAVALLLAVGVVALTTSWLSGRGDTASKISETTGSVAAAPSPVDAAPAESPSPAATGDDGTGTEKQAGRAGGRDQRRGRAGQKPKRPSAIKRAWQKFKRKLPF